MKIIGFGQLRNELSKGNLENWFGSLEPCDYIYIYDQASDDGSRDYYKKFDNTVVIESETNDFKNEIVCKSTLLERLLNDHPDTDWILWLDGDTVLDGRLLKDNNLKRLCEKADTANAGAVAFGHYNLWRSDIHYRLDNSYHNLHGNVIALWKNNGQLHFPKAQGLHNNQFPLGLTNIIRCDCSLIHKGFATNDQIIERYDIYKNRGQTGWDLDRLLDEDTLEVAELPVNITPDWYCVKDATSPLNKKLIRDIYNERSK